MTKALVVDDSSTVRSIITKMLASWGISAVQAGNGREAYASLENNADVDIAFVDWNMPVMNGIQLVQLIRSEEKYQGMKIVMVTTETEMPQIIRALEEGVNEYIMKPFTKEIFQEKLALLGVLDVSESSNQ